MEHDLGKQPRKGRGAVTNALSRRFNAQQRAIADDGWESAVDTLSQRVETVVGKDSSRRVITYNTSPDIPFDRSINPYQGCEHGCIYCFARPSHAHFDLSPGLDFETRIFAKHDAPALLRKELGKRAYKPDVITLGANTDPYQPAERRLEITRGILEVLAEANHPVCIVTKSARVARDLDILAPMAEKRLVRVMISLTTLNRELTRKLEPRAPMPARRLEAITGMKEAGVPVGVLAAPMIPAINDHELEDLLAAASEAGADSAGYVLLRLPNEIKELFGEWLDTHFPERKARVLKLVRDTRQGKLNDSTWGTRMKGQGHYAAVIQRRFRLACRQRGLNTARSELECGLFNPPSADPRQMALF